MPPSEPSEPSAPESSPGDPAGGFETFEGPELAQVLSHYELGIVEGVRVFRRGSRRSPKLRITAQTGEYLLKRRAAGRDDPFRVAFTHTLQLHLARKRFAVAPIIGTRTENNSLLNLDGRIYELFEYIHGKRFDRSTQQTKTAGRAMGRLHALLTDCESAYDAPTGSFHGAEADAQFARLANAVMLVEPDADEAGLRRCAARLRDAYKKASSRVTKLGFEGWDRFMIHGDWHPGNLLYRAGEVVAVLDFDSARSEPRMSDVANGALQFSMRMGEPLEPETWPDGIDVRRIRVFLEGYDDGADVKLERKELASLPWLIIEALIIESLVPIAATGRFARIPGSRFLEMVDRKVEWIRKRADRIVAYLEGDDEQ